MIDLRLRERIKLEKTIKLIPVVAFSLAATIDPFESESHDMVVEVLQRSYVPAHSVVAVMSEQL
uniref:Uncharacterized protein n=1 Tax=Candidatus Methanogaster sp. ANME-2c ERB4 TaxID=2759911 RepID=A0A7G9YDF6_9EURY|nr:hypothetical protein GMDKAGHH_00011 [Methanosarcinales archaeon ANME-2c ERB4]QNO46040.1 hypothetical protein OOGCPJEC_00025 [Methanosarcinales archaeon ANME-2c ERB4]